MTAVPNQTEQAPGALDDTDAVLPSRGALGRFFAFMRNRRGRKFNVGRWIVWGLFALVLLVAPLVFTSSLAQTILTQMGIAIIVCLSYNMLLGCCRARHAACRLVVGRPGVDQPVHPPGYSSRVHPPEISQVMARTERQRRGT